MISLKEVYPSPTSLKVCYGLLWLGSYVSAMAFAIFTVFDMVWWPAHSKMV